MTVEADRKRERETYLVPLLLILTAVTGAVDAVSILRLDRIFVANMTGNVAFLGFAIAGAPGFSASASFVALASFLLGAVLGGRLPARSPQVMLVQISICELSLCAVATVVAALAHGSGARYAMTVLLATAMGGRNAVVRRLEVADITTTVLTLTLTGLVGDRFQLLKPGSRTLRRLIAVLAMLAGAALGAVLVLHTSVGWALGAITGSIALVVIGALRVVSRLKEATEP